ncbi:type II toxin-antitoxin system VapC family toxin [Massilia sp. Root418]|uniref:type II toxin-antitoxin system VapC family toxin n=1 Tax=Massilia sp. Root418 TaxID=1736532 RepID=UPI000B0DCDCA|nr:type II toxin-antitoxin system VapC family toxin [Massilia sp. Root418]
MTLVLDASMALAWLFERTLAAEADCARRVLAGLLQATVVVPPLWHQEVANGALVGERRNLVAGAQIDAFLAQLRRLPVSTDETLPLPPISLARKCGLTVYDACYLELALRSGAVLATFDRRLAAAARGAGCAVFS